MITKAILIKPADKLLVRVWENKSPHRLNTNIDTELHYESALRVWNNSYKEYEVHPDYVDKMKRSVYDAWKESAACSFKELNPELIDFKEEEVPKWSGIFKIYAILNEQK